jgi:UPF0716 protein FxsA
MVVKRDSGLYARCMPLILVLLFIAIPIAELAVIIQVGQWIGVLPTIALLILDSLLGAALLRAQGRLAWSRFNLALAEGRVPAREVFDGAAVLFGGALLLTPGFITDVFGLLLLIPPTRAVIRRLLVSLVGGRYVTAWRVASWGGNRYRRRRGAGREYGPNGWPGDGGAARDYQYEGTAREIPEDPQELSEPGDGQRD